MCYSSTLLHFFPTLLPTIAAEEETAAPCRICNVMHDGNDMAGMVEEFIDKKDLKNWSCCSRRHYVKSVLALEEGKRRCLIKRFTVEAMRTAFKDFAEAVLKPDSPEFWMSERDFWKISRLPIESAGDKKNRWVKRLRFLCGPGVAETTDSRLGDPVVRCYVRQHRAGLKCAEAFRKWKRLDPEAAQATWPKYVGWRAYWSPPWCWS